MFRNFLYFLRLVRMVSEIRERAAEPAVYAKRHSAHCGGLAQNFLRLALGADEHYVLVVRDRFLYERRRLFKLGIGLFEVDY